MKTTLTLGAALLLTTSMAHAGGIERAVPSMALLFEDGNYLELSFGHVTPNVSGTQAITLGAGSRAGASSGNVTEDYSLFGFSYKNQINDNMAIALIIDEPYGANVNYAADTDYAFGGGLSPLGSTATIESTGITALLSYEMPNNVTVYGGPRVVRTAGEVALFNGYTMDSSRETDFGYVVGAGWERPDIAARVSLTYHSAVTHDFRADEFAPALGVTVPTEFTTTIPQSLTLEGQTGIAADTLLFGSIRWVQWSEFDISPTIYGQGPGNPTLVDYDDDVVTYNLGVGRRFSDQWSGALTAGYEASNGGFSGNLGPTDGNTALGVAATYTMGDIRITGGVRHIWIGDAETAAPAPVPAGTTLGNFDDNSAWALGLRVAYNF
ncbi:MULTISPECIES: OmpP1/FadL family transporter [unclassified Yoonia]|uniref:OmpP1/FadL family transporter n=1 Tax=unclassified Yoonia TaxID=2629118 RepID=UPI002B002831|nr:MULTISPECIES: outer membrane protein transport protein [unclassified Yoonia]